MPTQPIDLDQVAASILRAAEESSNEAELRTRVEAILKEVFEALELKWEPAHERTLAEGVRPDALYGKVVIEYKRPGTLSSSSGFAGAAAQVRSYIVILAEEREAEFSRYFGVVLDGRQIGFVRYRSRDRRWLSDGPYPVSARALSKLVEALRGLRRKPLDAQFLISDFGPRSDVARHAIRVLYQRLSNPRSPRTEVLFEDWRRVFSQVCAYSRRKIEGLQRQYEMRDADPERLLFSIHTYYALLMKLIAAEVAALYGDSLIQSYWRRLESAYYSSADELRGELERLEDGGVFRQLGILNFLEADYFSWYLNEWDEELARALARIVQRLSDYEVGTAELEPERVRDLFKELYQNLVPRRIRHDLGEFYTPDWLAELVLNQVGYDGDPSRRLLDPACGSGTFLVLALKRVRERAEERFLDPADVLESVTRNVVGFDLNPLAVIAARANYLLALGPLIRERREPIVIPVYLCDSILVEQRTRLLESSYVLRTVVGEFEVPAGVVERGVLADVLRVMEHCVRSRYPEEQFRELLAREVECTPEEVDALAALFNMLRELEEEGKDRIWLRILANSFAPLFVGRFDYVVGNPPWINWESLPEDYRGITRDLWVKFGLFEGGGRGIGRINRDIAMLFVATSIERYMNENGRLGMLIPFTVFKTKAGSGFRRFLATKCELIVIHDLVEMRPFEGATNRTSLMALKKGVSHFPVRCVVWSKSGEGYDPSAVDIEEVISLSNRVEMVLEPIRKDNTSYDASAPWILTNKMASMGIYKLLGNSSYKAYVGVHPGLNGVYWVQLLSSQPEGILVRNMSEISKKKLKSVEAVVEPDLVYPLVRGRDLRRWIAYPSTYMILPLTREGKVIPTVEMRTKYPLTYSYFMEFFDELISRNTEPYRSKLRPYRDRRLENIEGIPPFYWIFNAEPAISTFKVAWREVSGRISGKGLFQAAVIGPIEHPLLGKKPVLPDHKLTYIPLNNELEAYYVSAVLNSAPVRAIVAGYTIETAISTHIVEHVKVPDFDSANPLHLDLAELSKRAHRLAVEDDIEALREVESQIDKLVAQLYDLTLEELEALKETLKIFEGTA